MNRRLSLCLFALLGSGCLVAKAPAQTPAPAAPAPAAAPSTMSSAVPDLKLDNSQAPGLPEQQQMHTFVAGHLAVIVGGSAAEQAKSRDKLINAMPHTGGNVATAYIDAYARVLNDELIKALKTNPSRRAKLLIGVIAAKAAEHAEEASTPLSDTAEVLLQDDNEAIVLWGMKTAKYVMPGKLGGAPNMYKSLLDRIVPVGAKYPGYVLEEAYQALTLGTMKLKSDPKLLAQKPVIDRVKVVIPQVQALLAKRVADWNAGTPKGPSAESEATGFLTIPGVWPLQTPAQQRQTVSSIHELLTHAVPAFTAASGKDKDELRDLISRAAGGLANVGAFVSDAQLQGAAQSLAKLSPGMPTATVDNFLQLVTQAVKESPFMKAGPAPVSGGGPTTQSSAATVGQAAATK